MSDKPEPDPSAPKRKCVCLPIRLKWYGCLCGAVPQAGLNASGETAPPTKDEE